MKKNCRLTKSEDFKTVLDQRHCAGKNESVSVFYAPNTLTHARIGISVSNKVGNAVVRARVRRQIRAQINECEILGKPFDVVIIARPGYIQKTYLENLGFLKKAFVRLSVPLKGEQA